MALKYRSMKRFRDYAVLGLFGISAGLAFTASAQSDSMDLFGGDPTSGKFLLIPPDAPDWTRHFHIGAMAALNINADFKTKGTFNVSGNNPANGVYDDGYVKVDDTGNAGGLTGYWGYNNASQLSGNTLTMHGASSYSTSGSSKDNGAPFVGFDMAYGDNIWYWKHARVGWELGFGLLPINFSDTKTMSASVNQTTYVFNTGSTVVPTAPYQGGSSGEGPLISSTPSSTSSSTVAGTVKSTQTIDAILYTLRLGPSFYWDLNEYLGMSLGAGPAVGVASGSYRYTDTITVGVTTTKSSGSSGFTDLTYGGYVNGTLLYHVISNADLYLGAQFMPMSNAGFGSGGHSGQINLGGQIYISAGISWPF
jgi:hypothetical protein